MQTQLVHIDELSRELTLSLPLEVIEEKVKKEIRQFAKKAKVQGFRPGKVPLNIVEQNYGSSIREEVLSNEVHKAFVEFIDNENIKIAAFPKFKPGQTNNEEITFKAEFEVYPEFEIPDIQEIELTKERCNISEENVDKTIYILQKQRRTFQVVDDPAKLGDKVIVSFKGSINNEVIKEASADQIQSILGETPIFEEFKNIIIGMKAGESKDFKFKYPDEFENEKLKAKEVDFSLKVHEVAQPKLPDINEDFAKFLGIKSGNIDEMRHEIRKNVEREVNQRLKLRAKEQVLKAIDSKLDLKIPKALIQLEKKRFADNFKQESARFSGVKIQDIPDPDPQIFAVQAERRSRFVLIMNKLVEQFDIKASDQEIRKLIEDIAESYENPSEIIKWYYSKDKNLDDPRSVVVEENAINYVFSKAKVTDKEISFEDLMANHFKLLN